MTGEGTDEAEGSDVALRLRECMWRGRFVVEILRPRPEGVRSGAPITTLLSLSVELTVLPPSPPPPSTLLLTALSKKALAASS